VNPQTTLPADQLQLRHRQRPYLNWLERSRDNWKSKAKAARSGANRLRRSARLLAASRDRWRAQALDLRRQLRRAATAQEKNASRS
jgi:hypothetical protein